MQQVRLTGRMISESAVCSRTEREENKQLFTPAHQKALGDRAPTRCRGSPDGRKHLETYHTTPPTPFGSHDLPYWEKISRAALDGISRSGACRQTLVSCVGERGWGGFTLADHEKSRCQTHLGKTSHSVAKCGNQERQGRGRWRGEFTTLACNHTVQPCFSIVA